MENEIGIAIVLSSSCSLIVTPYFITKKQDCYPCQELKGSFEESKGEDLDRGSRGSESRARGTSWATEMISAGNLYFFFSSPRELVFQNPLFHIRHQGR